MHMRMCGLKKKSFPPHTIATSQRNSSILRICAESVIYKRACLHTGFMTGGWQNGQWPRFEWAVYEALFFISVRMQNSDFIKCLPHFFFRRKEKNFHTAESLSNLSSQLVAYYQQLSGNSSPQANNKTKIWQAVEAVKCLSRRRSI